MANLNYIRGRARFLAFVDSLPVDCHTLYCWQMRDYAEKIRAGAPATEAIAWHNTRVDQERHAGTILDFTGPEPVPVQRFWSWLVGGKPVYKICPNCGRVGLFSSGNYSGLWDLYYHVYACEGPMALVPIDECFDLSRISRQYRDGTDVILGGKHMVNRYFEQPGRNGKTRMIANG